MYGLPEDFSGKIFEGRCLQQICFNQNQVALHFDQGVSIVIENSFSYRAPGREKSARAQCLPVSSSQLMELLEVTVSKATGDDEGTLTLSFGNDATLKIFDDSDQYESYQFSYHGRTVIV